MFDSKKSGVSFFILIISLTFLSSVSAQLVSSWTLEGNIEDVWGDNNGETSTMVFYEDSQRGLVGNFDGYEDYIIIPDSSSLDLSEITLSAWVKLRDYKTDQRIISKEFGKRKPYSIYSLLVGADNNAELRLNIDGTRRFFYSSEALPLNEWIHVVATYDKNEAKIYINGALDSSVSQPGTIQSNDEPLYIGDSQFYDRGFNGFIDSVSLYNAALSSSEVAQLYEDTKDGDVSECNGGETRECDTGLLGVCGEGVQTCVRGSWGECEQVNEASVENCFDNLDNDCDGLVDEEEDCSTVLSSFWKFNDNSEDHRGNNHAILKNGAGYSSGEVDSVLSLDGLDDYAYVGNINFPGSQLTMSAWIYPKELGGCGPRIISKANGIQERDHIWMLSLCDGYLRARLRTDGVTETLIAEEGQIEPNKWSYVVSTYDGSQLKLYVNGVNVASMPKRGVIPSTNDLVSIGMNEDSDFPFNGYLDDVHISNDVMSEDKIVEYSKKYYPSAPDNCTDGDVRNCDTGLLGICSEGNQECIESNWTVCESLNSPVEEICFDNLDNDCDGFVDMEDSDCVEYPGCSESICYGDIFKKCVDGIYVDEPCYYGCVMPDGCLSRPPCLINDLYWHPEEAVEGEIVTVNIEGFYCDDIVDVQVYESDPLVSDLLVDSFEMNMSEPYSWVAQWECDGELLGSCLLGNPEYYFTFEYDGVEYKSSNLDVSKSPCGDGFCGLEEDCSSCPSDCGCEEGFICERDGCIPVIEECSVTVSGSSELNNAISSASQGDIICVEAGEYREVTFDGSTVGTSEQKIKLIAKDKNNMPVFEGINFNSNVDYNIVLDGLYVHVLDSSNGIYLENGASYVDIVNCVIEGTRDSQLREDYSSDSGVLLDAQDGRIGNVRIMNNEIFGFVRGIRTRFSLGNGIEIIGNEIYDTSGSAMKIPQSTGHGRIKINENHIYDQARTYKSNGAPTHGSAISLRLDNVEVKNNLLHGYAESSLISFYQETKPIEGYDNCLVEGNLLYDPSGLFSTRFFNVGENFVIRNNTIIGWRSVEDEEKEYGIGLYVSPSEEHRFSGLTIENNIVAGSLDIFDNADKAFFDEAKLENNIFYSVCYDANSNIKYSCPGRWYTETIPNNKVVYEEENNPTEYFKQAGVFFTGGSDTQLFSQWNLEHKPLRSGTPHMYNFNDAYYSLPTSDACLGIVDGRPLGAMPCEPSQIRYYLDNDGDGFGGELSEEGTVTNNRDCDDNNGAINPDASELCNNIDDNCDGVIDNDVVDCEDDEICTNGQCVVDSDPTNPTPGCDIEVDTVTELNNAKRSANPGDMVCINNGNYGELVFDSSDAKGTTSNPITYVGNGDDVNFDSVVINDGDWNIVLKDFDVHYGGTGDAISFRYEVSNVVLDGLYIEGRRGFTNKQEDITTDDISLSGIMFQKGSVAGTEMYKDIEIKNSEILKFQRAISTDGHVDNLKISGNILHYMAGSIIKLNTEYATEELVTIENNDIYDQKILFRPNGDQQHGSCISIRRGNLVIRNNTIHSCGSTAGIQTYIDIKEDIGYENILIEKNLFYDIRNRHIRSFDPGQNFVIRDNTLIGSHQNSYNATLCKPGTGSSLYRINAMYLQPSLDSSVNGEGVEIYNNLIVGEMSIHGQLGQVSAQDNLMYKGSSAYGEVYYPAKPEIFEKFSGDKAGVFFTGGSNTNLFNEWSYERNVNNQCEPHNLNLNDAYYPLMSSEACNGEVNGKTGVAVGARPCVE